MPAWRPAPPRSGAALQHFVDMSDPGLAPHIVADIVPEPAGSAARWTLRRPELRFRLNSTSALRLRVVFSLPGVVMEQTGPLTISFFVAGHLLERVRYGRPGEHVFEAPVPAAWLATDAPVHVRLELDKIWVAPTDRVQRGIQLFRLGFVR